MPQELRWDVPTGKIRISLPGLLDLFNSASEFADFFDIIGGKLPEKIRKSDLKEGLRSGDNPQLLPWGRGPHLKRLIRVFGRKHHINNMPQELTTTSC
jgi:hypothetical protein